MVEHVLEVTSPLSVHIFPPQQVTDSGRTAVFNCTVDGFPVLNVYWLKNGQILVPSSRVSPGTGSLTIRGVQVSVGPINKFSTKTEYQKCTEY